MLKKYFDMLPTQYRCHIFREMGCDPEWNVPIDWDEITPNSIEKTLLGSGYYTSHMFGHSGVRPIAVKLKNGDHLVCFFNCFYHK